jgi:hypothetical protein
MRSSRLLKGIAITLVVLLILGCLALRLLLPASGPLGQTTDISCYAEIRDSFEGSILIQHFPEVIPSDATEVKLEYLPRLMQGGSHFQLRLKLPSNQIEGLYSHFDAIAKLRCMGCETIHDTRLVEVPTTFFYTSDTDDVSFPESYEILVLDAQPGGSPEFEWNHGHSYGVAIDISASEAVYWFEYW